VSQLAKIFDRVAVVGLPLKTPFRGLSTRELVLVQGERWAEFSPFIEYSTQESLSWLGATLEWAFGDLPPLVRDSIPINATLPTVKKELVGEVLADFGEFSTVKAKVADTDILEDLARLLEVKRQYPTVKIRVDANGAWSISEAIEFASRAAELGLSLEYLEQPVRTIPELAELKEKLKQSGLKIPIAADESIRKETDPLEVVRVEAADILILKAAPLGGIRSALEIAEQAKLPVVVSGALESSIGLQAELHFAGALENLDFDCGLATATLFESDVVGNPLLPSAGQITIPEVEPDEKLLSQLAVSADRKEFLLERLDKALELLESGIDV
jgi:O-succinylbenzoate synthase